MNFQDLMSKATENSKNASIQQRKSGHLHKDNSPGVSNSAIQAFLARKQQQEKQKQADQEAARRARIEARLEQSVQQKKGTKRGKPSETTVSNQATNNEQEKPKKSKHLPPKERKKSSTPEASNHEKPRKQAEKTVQNKIDKPITSSTTIKKTKSKVKSAAPPNFKELLAIAERNKLGLNNKPKQNTKPVSTAMAAKDKCKQDKRQEKKEHVGIKKETKSLSKKHISGATSVQNDKQQKSLKHKDKTKTSKDHGVNRKPSSQAGPSKGSAQPQPYSQMSTSRSNPYSTSTSRPNPYNTSTSRHNPYNTSTSRSNSYSKSTSRPGPNNGMRHGPYNGSSSSLHRQSNANNLKRQYQGYCDDDEEDDDDMEGFIDDGELHSAEDVSAHIREIFGYDRKRFASDLDDFDDTTMESSYSQIEREEHRSSKIAKLEDEIAFLKEQADLKREKEQLMKGKKKSRK